MAEGHLVHTSLHANEGKNKLILLCPHFSPFILLKQNTIEEWVAYKPQTFICHSSGGWKSKLRCWQVWCLGKASSRFIASCPLSASSHGRRRKASLWDLFCKCTNPFKRASCSWPNLLAKAPPPNTILLGIRFQCMYLGKPGAQTFSPQQPLDFGASLSHVSPFYHHGAS